MARGPTRPEVGMMASFPPHLNPLPEGEGTSRPPRGVAPRVACLRGAGPCAELLEYTAWNPRNGSLSYLLAGSPISPDRCAQE